MRGDRCISDVGGKNAENLEGRGIGGSSEEGPSQKGVGEKGEREGTSCNQDCHL